VTKYRRTSLQAKIAPVPTNALRAARIAMGWSITDLAEASGVPKSTIGYAELGRGVHASTAVRLAAALNRRVEDLWGVRDIDTELERDRIIRMQERKEAITGSEAKMNAWITQKAEAAQ
jgi:transcriptional regulator with XRE-family HTH domain